MAFPLTSKSQFSNFVVSHRNIFKEVTMKKSLIALAVLGSVAGVAQAQSSVTLYGMADVYAARVKAGPVGAEVSTSVLNSGGLAQSRFGLQGVEDLGGGLKAIFKLEQGFDASNGTALQSNTAFNRQSWVGLEGGFGTVQFGNVFAAFDDAFYFGSPLFDSFVFSPGSANYSLNGNQPVLSVYNYAFIQNNAIRYTTPNMGGFTASASHSLKESNAATATNQTDFSVQYVNGPLSVALAYEQINNGGLTAGTDQKYTYVTAAYDLGVAVLRGGVGSTREVLATKTNDYQIGADFPLSSALTLSTGFSSSTDKDGSDTKRSGIAVGATYTLSKRTLAYAALNSSKREVAGATTHKFSFIGAGLQHKF